MLISDFQVVETQYEEIAVWEGNTLLIHKEFDFNDYGHTIATEISDGGLLESVKDREVAKAEFYYDGDHMVAEFEIL